MKTGHATRDVYMQGMSDLINVATSHPEAVIITGIVALIALAVFDVVRNEARPGKTPRAAEPHKSDLASNR